MTTQEKLAALGFAGRAAEAAALVIDHGLARNKAAQAVGVNPSAVTRLLGKITLETKCRCCGQLKKEIKI